MRQDTLPPVQPATSIHNSTINRPNDPNELKAEEKTWLLKIRRELGEAFARASDEELLHPPPQWIEKLAAMQTQLRHALESAESQRARYETALRATGDVIWEWEFSGNRVIFNEAIESTFLHPLATVENAPSWWLSQIHPDHYDRVVRSLGRFLESGDQLWQVEYPFRKGNGEYAEVHCRAFLIRDFSGKAERIVGATQDVTGRKHLEFDLRRSNEELEACVRERTTFLNTILDNLDDGITACDRQGRVTLINRAARTLYGDHARPFPATEWYKFVRILNPKTMSQIPEHELPLMRALRGEHVRQFELLTELYDGRRRYLCCDAVPLMDSEGENIGAVIVMHDKTIEREAMLRTRALEKTNENLQKSQSELLRTNTELEQFAAVAAHDLKSPLNSITQFTDLLAEEYRGRMGSDADEIIDFITDASARMRRFVDSLLYYARSGATIQVQADVDTKLVCELAVKNLKASVASSGAKIILMDLPKLPADEDRLLQVFQNLISNAIKYSLPDVMPVVEVSARPLGRNWLFTVRDNGIGIDPEEAASLFDLFHRAKNVRGREGSGVGLAVCKKIIEAHGGKIWIESEIGHGSSVCFTLPASL